MRATGTTLKELKVELKELESKRRDYISTMLEGGEGYNPFDDKLGEVGEKLSCAMELAEKKEWTKAITEERRAMWNGLVRSGKIKNINNLVEQEKKQGWKTGNLKRYIKFYEL